MLGERDAVVTIAVKNLDVARKFYEETLDLTPAETGDPEFITYRSGNSQVGVYRSDYAGTNQATTVMWSVGEDLDDIVRELKRKGVTFEHYDLPGMTLDGDVHVAGELRAAWFKDPDGNILNLSSM